ncbi:MAG: hypothetical protein M3R25_03320, partial [Bacteroidota bacterium]|nr:hypothetical protein [Bacteroidota bacterium]
MWIRDHVNQYLLLTGFCLLILVTLVGIDHVTHDKTHFAQQLEQKIHELEAEAEQSVQEGDWISQIRSIQNKGKIFSNDLVSRIEDLSHKPFSIYVYHLDSLLFWSQPGMIIDPTHKEFASIPCVISDHRQDYYVKQMDLADNQDLLKVYFKIPIIPETEQEYSIGVTKYQFGHPTPNDATLIRSKNGSPIAHVQLLSKEFSFVLQCLIFIFCMGAFWSLIMAWISMLQERPEHKVSHVNKVLLQMAGVLCIRMATLFIPYHDFFDQLNLLSPIIQDITFPYSTMDLLIDSAIFLWLCTLASKIYNRDFIQGSTLTSPPPIRSRWGDRVMTTSHYLVVIMMCGLTAWILRQVVGQSNFKLDLGEVSLFDIHHFLSILACGLIVMGVFTFSFQIVTRAIFYTQNFYERMIALLAAGALSIPMLSLIEIDLPLVGFYLGVFILMTLLDLYIDQGNRSVIWVLSWLITISSMTALVLYKYQRDFEKIARTELIEQVPIGSDQKLKDEEHLIEWLYKLPRKYSLAIYQQDGQLV